MNSSETFWCCHAKHKLQYITSSIDKDQVLWETFDKVQTLQQINVFLLVDQVQIRPIVSISATVVEWYAARVLYRVSACAERLCAGSKLGNEYELFLVSRRELALIATDLFPNVAYNEATIYDFIEDDPFFEILSPTSLQYTYRLRQAKNFGTNFMFPQHGLRLVLADPEDACSHLYNAADIDGAVALVIRGACSFVSKAVQVEKAGAVAIIVTDMDAATDTSFIEMIADGTEREPSIPAYFLLGRNGEMILQTLRNEHLDAAIINIPVNLTNVQISKLNQPPWIVW
ncbi:PA domain [Trinorchestia longiramus]|nr:PA domain [Trinorchestia longiramus]